MKRKLFYSISFIMTLVIVLLMIPVSALIVIMANQMVSSIETELNNSYYNELGLYMTKVDDGIDELDRNTKEIIQDNWYHISETFDDAEAELAKYSFFQRLKTMQDSSSVADIAFLKTKWDNDIRLSYDPSVISYETQKTFVDFLDQDLQTFSNYEYFLVKVDSRDYFMRVVNLKSYVFGVFIDIEKLLEPLTVLRATEDEIVAFADLSGNLVSNFFDCTLDYTQSVQNIDIEGKTTKYWLFSYPSTTMQYKLVHLIPEEQRKLAIPFVQRMIQVLAFFSILLMPIMWLILRQVIIKPLKMLDNSMKQIESDQLEYRIQIQSKVREFNHLYNAFNAMTDRIKHLTIETYEKDIENLEIESTNLRLQMNPHMILNSLNMIYSLAQSKNVELIKVFSIHLVEYFRYVLGKNEILVPLSREINFVKNYLEIQKIRFPNSFVAVFDVEDVLSDKLVPPLIIQNFVENTIKYGLKMGSEIEILIIAKSDGEHMSVAVCDTGNGMETETLQLLREGQPVENRTGTHIGIWNSRRRLNRIFGNRGTMTITSALNEGTQVWMEIPLVEQITEVTDEFTNR